MPSPSPTFDLVTTSDWLPWWGEQRRGVFRLKDHFVIPGAKGVGGFNGLKMESFAFYRRPRQFSTGHATWETVVSPIRDGHVVTQPPCSVELNGKIWSFALSTNTNRPLACVFNPNSSSPPAINLLWNGPKPIDFPAKSGYLGAAVVNGDIFLWHSCFDTQSTNDRGCMWMYCLKAATSNWIGPYKQELGGFTSLTYCRSVVSGDGSSLILGGMLQEGVYNPAGINSFVSGVLRVDSAMPQQWRYPSLTVIPGSKSPVDVTETSCATADPLPMSVRSMSESGVSRFDVKQADVGSPRLVKWDEFNTAAIGWTGPTWNAIAVNKTSSIKFVIPATLPNSPPPCVQFASQSMYGTRSLWDGNLAFAVPHSASDGRLYYLDLSGFVS